MAAKIVDKTQNRPLLAELARVWACWNGLEELYQLVKPKTKKFLTPIFKM